MGDRLPFYNFKLIRSNCLNFDGKYCQGPNNFDGLCSDETCELTIAELCMINMEASEAEGGEMGDRPCNTCIHDDGNGCRLSDAKSKCTYWSIRYKEASEPKNE